MSGVDFVQWLRDQLDEEAEEARAAAEAYGAVWTADEAMESVSSDTGADVVEEPNAPHAFIAAHDPARVLREIDAKRAIVDDLAEFIRWGAYKGLDYQDGVDACGLTLKRLALPYADRSGYREEWRP